MNLGIISSDYINLLPNHPQSFESEEIVREAKKHFKQVFLIDPYKTYIKLTETLPIVFCPKQSKKNENIFDEIDVIYVRRTRGAIEQILDILRVINRFYPKISIFDKYESLQNPTSKVNAHLKRYGLFKQPNTIIISNKDFNPNDVLLEYPVLIKPSSGLRGIGVELCNDEAELEKYISKTRTIGGNNNVLGYGFLLQEHLKIKEEYRIVVIGGKSLGCVRKVQEDEKKIAKNYAQGAEFELVEDKLAEKLAIKASKIFNQSFSGVDVVLTTTEDYYILECNRNPNYAAFKVATQINVSKEICQYLLEETKKNTKVMNQKKRIFIGCSGNKGKEVAEMVHLNLYKDFETSIWNHSVFRLGDSNLDSLISATNSFDYAILIMTPDDEVIKKDKKAFIPRDNVLFELGLFMGKLGKKNVFMLLPESSKPSLPTDLDGIVYATYPSDRADENLSAAVDIGCIKIKQELKNR